jgi:hypothetical protein
MPRRIGLDVGGVIIDATANDGTDTDIRGDRFMEATPVAGAYDAVRELIDHYGADNIFIISKCGELIEDRTREWLAGNGFYAYTGFNPENLHFCRRRAEKASIAKTLDLSDFVDDHQDVLEYMEGIVARHYLFGPQSDEVLITDSLIAVGDWPETIASILQEV